MHFADSDNRDNKYSKTQSEEFLKAVNAIKDH
jgi:hypothetical protein